MENDSSQNYEITIYDRSGVAKTHKQNLSRTNRDEIDTTKLKSLDS